MRFAGNTGRLALVAFAVGVLVGCGGGSDGGAAAGAQAAASQIHGTVVNIEGARVYLDLNHNLERDAGEPETVSAAPDGAFTLPLPTLNAGELAMATLVAEIPLGAKDGDDSGMTMAQAGRQTITLSAPASAFLRPGATGMTVTGPVVISPLTALVAAEASHNGMPSADGVRTIQDALALGTSDPMATYTQQQQPRMWRLARLAGISFGEYLAAAARAGGEHGDPTAREQLRFATRLLKENLPALEAQFSTAIDVAAVRTTARDHLPGGGLRLADGFVRYIVRFKSDVPDPEALAAQFAAAHGGRVRFRYEHLLQGFAIEVPEASVLSFVDVLDTHPQVDRVEPDQPVSTVVQVQDTDAWGLDRIDQRILPLAKKYAFNTTGAGVRAYILDSGIRSTHAEFQGRVAQGFNAIADGRGTDDCHGHGTHVAGTVGGRTWGVAKEVTLVPVRVLGCDGTGLVSGIVAGLDWVMANAPARSVVNMSIGAGASATLDAAVDRAVNSRGIPVVVAAGNSNVSACTSSPARAAAAITVGASDTSDRRASFSNFGTCLDVFAPGVGIPAAGIASDTVGVFMSGTSMASPHVAGYVARVLERSPSATPAQVTSIIKANATSGLLQNIGVGSPDALLFASPSTDLLTAPEPAPVALVSVGAMTGATWNLFYGSWRGSVTIAVKNNTGALVPGAIVRGGFSVGGSNLQCVTMSNGTCTLFTGALGRTTPSTRFTVTSVTSTTGTYNAAANHRTTVDLIRP